MKVKKKNFIRYLKYFLNREMDLIFIVSNVKVNWMGILYIICLLYYFIIICVRKLKK